MKTESIKNKLPAFGEGNTYEQRAFQEADQVKQEDDPVNQSQELSTQSTESPRPARESVSVPSEVYARIGQGYLDVCEQLQALWDAVYLTHPDKERLLRAYVRRIDQLRGGASPMLSVADYQLEQLATSLNLTERGAEN